jgi:coproporphyrinogen III oxidase
VDKSAKFKLDKWTKPLDAGYGISAIVQDSKIFEKAGVNYSVLRQKAPKNMLMQMADKIQVDLDQEYEMFVAGVSMVIHPKNPNAPTFHANLR